MSSTTPNVTTFALKEMFDRLFEAYGPQHWWPAKTKTEIVVGAILTQNTNWTNVERAIENLRAAEALSWVALRTLPEGELADLIRPSGTFRIKAKRIKSFVRVLWREGGGSLDTLLRGPVDEVRARLLAINGIGPETADAILLYAGGRPVFVVDAYARRILRRHGIISDTPSYSTVQSSLHAWLPQEAGLFNEFHALLVTVGKRHCRTTARCAGCPLEALPHDDSQ